MSSGTIRYDRERTGSGNASFRLPCSSLSARLDRPAHWMLEPAQGARASYDAANPYRRRGRAMCAPLPWNQSGWPRGGMSKAKAVKGQPIDSSCLPLQVWRCSAAARGTVSRGLVFCLFSPRPRARGITGGGGAVKKARAMCPGFDPLQRSIFPIPFCRFPVWPLCRAAPV